MSNSQNENLTLVFRRGSSKPIIASTQRPIHIPKNHILICVDRFGFSANNITYQALGEHPHFRYGLFNQSFSLLHLSRHPQYINYASDLIQNLRYFDFHAPPSSPETGISPKTHGVVPVWGFGTVVASSHSKIQVGERLYGYLAPTRYLLVEIDPNDVNKHAIYVPRPEFPVDRRLYNQILRCSSDPVYTKQTEDLIMLYRPLFWTSFWCEDWLYCSGYTSQSEIGCDALLISSASSKTAFCFAYCVRKRLDGKSPSSSSAPSKNIKLIGLTSAKNLSFTRALDLYDEVYTYDSFTTEPTLQGTQGVSRWIYSDVTGNDNLNERILNHFQALKSCNRGKLVMSISLGMTNLTPATSVIEKEESRGLLASNFENVMGVGGVKTDTGSNGNKLEFSKFFTPEWLEIRRKQIPIQEIFAMQKRAWEELISDCQKGGFRGDGWIQVEHLYAGETGSSIKEAYEKIAREGVPPDVGMVWSMWGGEAEADAMCKAGNGNKSKL